MFGEIKELAKLASLLKNGPAMQAKIDEARSRLAAKTVTAEVGGGAVTVVADGTPRIRSIRIEPALLAALVDGDAVAGDDADRSLAESLIADAVNHALALAQEMMMREMAEAAREMDLPIPKQMLDGLLQGPLGGGRAGAGG